MLIPFRRERPFAPLRAQTRNLQLKNSRFKEPGVYDVCLTVDGQQFIIIPPNANKHHVARGLPGRRVITTEGLELHLPNCRPAIVYTVPSDDYDPALPLHAPEQGLKILGIEPS